ncbi:MAG: right-handed parallel beta-helix repeat-containing protein [Anaerolineae bacterium]|nr:right-handed parallel beta-helix repeat-containing protein [Anaerolineae bacterium]
MKQVHRSFNVTLVLALLAALCITEGAWPRRAFAADESVAVIRQSCSGYGGPEPCYGSLAAWEADYGGVDFGGNPQGDLVAADKIAVARIEGAWTQADTAPLNLSGWTTDAEHYVRIYTTGEARHDGTPGSGYRLATTGSRPISSYTAHFRIEGLEIRSLTTGSPVYARPGTGVDGDIRISHSLIHGNGVDSGSGIFLYDYDGTARIWNNIIYDVSGLGYLGGIQTSRGMAYVYNNTIVDLVAGFAIRSGGAVVAKNNLTESPGDDFYGVFYPGTDFNASSDDTAPGLHSRRNQAFAFLNRPGNDFHLAAADAGARNYGTDLASDAHISIADDADGDARSGGWDIGADEATSGTDAVPPIRSDGAPGGTLPSYTTAVTLTLSTNEAAICRYAVTPGVAYGSMPHTFSVTGGTAHTQLVTGLVDEQTYTTYVRCQDTASNVNADDYEISFYIFSSDTVPPVLSNVGAANVTSYSAEITWETDEGCTSQIEYGKTDAYGTISPISSTLVTSHALTLLGLDSSTTYHFRVRSQDVAYNETMSGHYTFTTAALSGFRYVNQNHPSASDGNMGMTVDDPWLTIQHAADVAQPGDTIIIYPGSYGRVTINEGGTPGSYITFKGLNVPDQGLVDPDVLFDPADPVPVPGNPAVNAVMRGFTLQPAYMVTEPVSYVRIENLEITNVSSAGYVGASAISMQDTAHIEVVGNFIHDVNPFAHGVGIQGSGQNNVGNVIRGNTLYRVQGVGISIVGRDWLVEGNDISHGLDVNTYTGGYDGSDTDAVRFFGSGHVIRNNAMSDYLEEEQLGDPHIDCFQTFSVYPESQYAHDILVEGNFCDNFGQMFMVEDQSEAAGTGNAVHHITFRNNVLRGARAVAINGSCDHFTFVNNVVADSHYSAIGINRSPYLTLANNIFYNNGSGSQIFDEDTKVGSVWDYNLHYPDFEWPHKQPAFDQHSMFGVAPWFLNPSAGDYRLRFDSPAIDAGTTLHEFNYDAHAVGRPHGAAWDIGACEFIPSLELYGSPGNGFIYLYWTANLSMPVASTWQISYITATAPSPVLETDTLTHTARTYTLAGLENGQWYTVTLTTVGVTPPLSDTVAMRLMEHFVYLPHVLR